jgi:hypothetical protein
MHLKNSLLSTPNGILANVELQSMIIFGFLLAAAVRISQIMGFSPMLVSRGHEAFSCGCAADSHGRIVSENGRFSPIPPLLSGSGVGWRL